MDDPASRFFFLFQNTDVTASISLAEVLWKFGLLFVIVGLNAFFVASEFALVSVRKIRVKKSAEEGSRGAKAALRLLANPTLFISAVQLGVTLASLAIALRTLPLLAGATRKKKPRHKAAAGMKLGSFQ